MLKFYEGTVFNTNAEVLVNTVNCEGVMGAGIALEFKLRYPEMYDQYKIMCDNNEYRIGKPKLHKLDNVAIMNFPTKNHWRGKSNIKWIEDGLDYFRLNYQRAGINSIAFPKLGTLNGGLNWEEVKDLMVQKLSNLENIEITICLDTLKEAEGIEKLMLDELNETFEIMQLDALKLSKKQCDAIRQLLPLDRFWKLSKIKGLGQKTYSKIFSHFYNHYAKNSNVKKVKEIYEQISIF